MYTPQNWNGLIRGNLVEHHVAAKWSVNVAAHVIGKINGANYNKNYNKFVKLASVYGFECGGDITEQNYARQRNIIAIAATRSMTMSIIYQSALLAFGYRPDDK